MSKISQTKDLGPLQDLFLRACPANKDGMKSIPILARRLNRSPQSLYYCISVERITPKVVLEIIALSDGRVSLEDFHKYVYQEAPCEK